jgi:hypothetical protein
MMITSSGAKCDVCGKFILPFPGELVNCFGITCIKEELHCDNACKKILQEIGGEWIKLPYGPLRRVFEQSMQNTVKERKHGM